MNTDIIQPPLSNIQAELLKLFSADIPENDLIEIKNLIAHYLLDKAGTKPILYGKIKVIRISS